MRYCIMHFFADLIYFYPFCITHVWFEFMLIFFFFFFAIFSNNFFPIKNINDLCPQLNIFKCFSCKNFSGLIWNVTFCKNIFTFWYSNIISNFKFRIFINNSFTRVNISVWFYITGFILIVLWYVLLSLLTISSNLLFIHILWYWSHLLINFL